MGGRRGKEEGLNMKAMIIGAHPDDWEFSCGGTAIKFAQRGDVVVAVSVTNGNKGHFSDEYKSYPSKLAARRMEEAKKAAEMIGAIFETLDVDDGEVYITKELTERMVRLIRKHKPDLLITNRPVDYHRDHRYTAQLILDAAYMLTVPLFCPDTPHLERMPVIAYWWDRFEEIKPFRADVVVPIDDVIDKKVDLLMAHESQVFEWLPYNTGELENIPSDRADRRKFLARKIEGRAETVRRSCERKIKRLFGENDFHYVEAFQISQYGRQPDPEELSMLFPI